MNREEPLPTDSYRVSQREGFRKKQQISKKMKTVMNMELGTLTLNSKL
jgi:hypothetical protein